MKATKLTLILIVAILVISISMITMMTAIAAEMYDLVILNGRVMDPESQLDAVRKDWPILRDLLDKALKAMEEIGFEFKV